MTRPSVLILAGLDPTGGAGLLADIRTATLLGAHAVGVATALTVQNGHSTPGHAVPPEVLEAQLRPLIQRFRPTHIKVGLITHPTMAEAIASVLRPCRPGLILDPVITASDGGLLASPPTLRAIVDHLFPLADLVTPNVPEAQTLAGLSITCRLEAEGAAERLLALGPKAVLIKGGHLEPGTDLLAKRDNAMTWLFSPSLPDTSLRGTGCFLSTAIACLMAAGLTLAPAVERARALLRQALGGVSLEAGGMRFIDWRGLGQMNQDSNPP